jgi:SAM-dependent methyltransferase
VDPRLGVYQELAELGDAELARRLYRLALRREPDPEGLARAENRLADGTLSPAALLVELVGSEEFVRVRALDDAVAFASWARAAGERPRELHAPPDIDERAIEIPWALARYRHEARVLDAGHAFAEPAWLSALAARAPGEVVGVDLAQAEVPGYRGVVADLRRLPFDDGSFDVAFCISTLEHIGRDNQQYGVQSNRDPDGMIAALGELRRVLGHDGRLLLSVPCGRHQELEEFVQLEPAAWLELVQSAGFVAFEHELYELSDEGWSAVTTLDPDLVYGARGPGASAVLCLELHPAGVGSRLRAAARRIRS